MTMPQPAPVNTDPARHRPTYIGGGIQYHHQHSLNRASICLVNAVQYLAGVTERVDDPELFEIERQARALAIRIEVAHQRASASWDHYRQSDPAGFDAAHKGHIPFPDERADGFTPICYCGNRCLWHDHQPPWATEQDCNCAERCPRHGQKVVEHRDVDPLPRPDPAVSPRHHNAPLRQGG